MLLPAHAPCPAADRFRALPVAAGLRSLLVQAPPDAAPRGIVTRTVTARCCRDTARYCRGGEDVVVEAIGEGTSTAQGQGIINETNVHDDEDTAKEKKEAGSAEEEEEEEEEEELDGFWVSYGRRWPRRRLPPPLPSLVARGALRRARTGDGRLVIRIVPLVRPERVRARRCRRGDSLNMRLVERQDDDSTVMAPPLIQHEDGIGSAPAERLDDVDPAAVGVPGVAEEEEEEEAVPEPTTAPAMPPPRVSSVGCFEEVFRFDLIGGGGGGTLHQMPSRLRMVH
ncbi:hypothetical protein HU200_017369 [Digitaria exilis]|uniref:FAF domain-containing protein n=1 Tax=Digitaria exilis TaxID=1010633 RepID=A0A835F6Y7_9POAL|nr:hypothetical protein HU200_017369 [Digitaria exilis]